MAQVEPKRLGKYDIVSVLGRGAMGVVYKGYDPGIERHVALKTVRADAIDDEDAKTLALQGLKRDARAAGKLQHPNIVGVYDYGEEEGIAFIAIEFIQGRSVKDFLDEKRTFTVAEIVTIMDELLTALEYSHQRGVVHRDIKPANVMITDEKRVKICDFGIAKVESSTATQTGMIMGTAAYMPPEQFMALAVDARSDIHAAGVMLYQLLAGKKPFEGTTEQIMYKVLNVVPDPPSSVNPRSPHSLDPVVAKAMAKKPEDRFQSAEEFRAALRLAADSADVEATVPDEDATLVAIKPSALSLEDATAQMSGVGGLATRTNPETFVAQADRAPLQGQGGIAPERAAGRDSGRQDSGRQDSGRQAQDLGQARQEGRGRGGLIAAIVALVVLLGGAAGAWFVFGAQIRLAMYLNGTEAEAVAVLAPDTVVLAREATEGQALPPEPLQGGPGPETPTPVTTPPVQGAGTPPQGQDGPAGPETVLTPNGGPTGTTATVPPPDPLGTTDGGATVGTVPPDATIGTTEVQPDPPPQPAGPPGYARIVSRPDGARVFAPDGTDLGVTPVTVKLAAGEYILKVRKDGYLDGEIDVEILPEFTVSVSADLTLK
ncbi:protein kinase domain-containing protein [Zavarzinia sp. CC-PAN008]|uniref:serine/threonine-protein kinase n=1 Tax=Zavarzinia sp. CC-PAN008 TaxID=3243332 RepID=UPI003F749C06